MPAYKSFGLPLLTKKVGSGLIVNKGNDEALAKFSTAMTELKADGTLKKLGEQFFGKDISVK